MSNVNSSNTYSKSPAEVIQKLSASIHHVTRNIQCYCSDPLTDFTRSRIWTPDRIMKFLIQLESNSMKTELNNFFPDSSVPYDSSICQQRGKLMPEALERVLYLFTRSFRHSKTIKGYHLIAADGSDINIPYDPHDRETACGGKSGKEYSQYHLNALYDCRNRIFWDINIDTASKTRELDALKEMIIDHNYPVKSIITADRGYESYELIACCNKSNQKFVIRVKDTGSNGILSNCDLPQGEFDTRVIRILTRKQTLETKNNKSKYVLLVNASHFSYLDVTEDFYEMEFRVVRFQLSSGVYECLVTNLDEDEFSMKELKQIYHERWEIESGFRKLKYTVSLINFHSRKRAYIRQEIAARIIMYNLTSIIAAGIETKVKGKKHELAINFTQAVTNIRRFIRGELGEEDLIKRIKKYLVPVRPDRSCPRQVKPQRAKPFNNRAA